VIELLIDGLLANMSGRAWILLLIVILYVIVIGVGIYFLFSV
jgi:hypothetical protein